MRRILTVAVMIMVRKTNKQTLLPHQSQPRCPWIRYVTQRDNELCNPIAALFCSSSISQILMIQHDLNYVALRQQQGACLSLAKLVPTLRTTEWNIIQSSLHGLIDPVSTCNVPERTLQIKALRQCRGYAERNTPTALLLFHNIHSGIKESHKVPWMITFLPKCIYRLCDAVKCFFTKLSSWFNRVSCLLKIYKYL